MKILYIDCAMGAAGDMLAGALLALLPEAERADFLRRLNALLPEGVEAAAGPRTRRRTSKACRRR